MISGAHGRTALEEKRIFLNSHAKFHHGAKHVAYSYQARMHQVPGVHVKYNRRRSSCTSKVKNDQGERRRDPHSAKSLSAQRCPFSTMVTRDLCILNTFLRCRCYVLTPGVRRDVPRVSLLRNGVRRGGNFAC